MELSLKQSDFLGSFDFIWSKSLDQYDKNKLNLFMLKINSNEFDYDLLEEMLICRLPAQTATCAIFGGHSVT